MGVLRTVAALPAVLLIVACGKSRPAPDATLNTQLRSDLDRAAAPTAELAASRYRADQAISAIELGRAPRSPVVHARATARKRVVHRAVATGEPRVQAVAVAPRLEPATQPATVTVAAAPLPAPTTGPVSDASDHHSGLGHIIGVLIRGGMLGDDDHCDLRAPHGTVMINSRFPRGGVPAMPRPQTGGPRGIW